MSRKKEIDSVSDQELAEMIENLTDAELLEILADLGLENPLDEPAIEEN